MIEDLLKALKGFLLAMEDNGKYKERKVARDSIMGLVVSTAITSDYGYETAIKDKNGIHPVERYSDKESAILGHKKWLKEAETITRIKKLGAWDVIPDEMINLDRYEY